MLTHIKLYIYWSDEAVLTVRLLQKTNRAPALRINAAKRSGMLQTFRGEIHARLGNSLHTIEKRIDRIRGPHYNINVLITKMDYLHLQ